MKSNFKILLVEDMESFRGAVSQLLGVYNDIHEAADLSSARAALAKSVFDVVVLDKGLPDGDGIDLIADIKELNPNAVVIVLTSDSDFSSVKHCIARGADDYVIKSENIVPDLLIRIPVAVSKAASTRRLKNLEQQVKDAFRYEIVGKSPSTMELREFILSLKGSGAHVLITGESGTGKELIARRLNSIEDDGKRPFVAINCGAISENLIESELFGHKKGAFTGALTDRAGKFEAAHGGDLFLDEIGELPLPAQVRLLRAIQEGEITRVGDNRVIKVNCRIIAATNQNLDQMVKAGKFREDLFHRLNVVRIQTTPLRERRGDIRDMAKMFTLQVGGSKFKIADAALNSLSGHEWPGNIRELRNSIERAVISARRRQSDEIRFEDVSIYRPAKDSNYRMKKIESALPSESSELTANNYREFIGALHREYLETALELVNGNVENLAIALGLGRSTAFKRLREFGVRAVELRGGKSPIVENRPADENLTRGMT
ncbi:MAG: sigma-54-dependent transcriptional regulator [Bdellovibrionales bacterium]